MSKLKELYYGNICPIEKTIEKGSEYYEFSKKAVDEEEKLLKNLNNEEKEIYENILQYRSRQSCILEEEIFADGFRLGAQIILEILMPPKKQLRDIWIVI